MKAWVLWWRYSDGSSFEVVRAYLDETRAKEDFDLVSQYSEGKTYYLSVVPCFGTVAPVAS